MKLFLKGAKCFSEKCAIEKRNFAPGQHGKDRKAKIVGYGLQLREKSRSLPIIQQAMEYTAHQAAPGWLEVNREALKGRVVNLPKREDINLPINEQLIVELYSK